MAGPEFNPADDVQPTKEEYEAWERKRKGVIRLADWLYSDSGEDDVPIETIEADLRESGIDMEQAKVRMREMISRLSRTGR